MTAITSGAQSFPPMAALGILSFAALFLLLRAGKGRVDLSAPVAAGMALSSVILGARLTFAENLVNDEIVWHEMGVEASKALSSGRTEGVSYIEGKEGYIWLLGLLYQIATPAPIVAISLNILVMGGLILVVGKTGFLIADEFLLEDMQKGRAALAAAWMIALSPTILFWVPRALRESICLLLIALTLYGMLSLGERRIGGVLLVLTALAALVSIRAKVGLAVAVAVGISLILSLGARRLSTTRWLLLVALLPAGGFWVFRRADAMFGLSLDDVSLRTRDLATASSGFAGAADANLTWVEILTITTPRVLGGPFPWELNVSGVMILALVDLVFWGSVLFLSLVALRRFRGFSSNPRIIMPLLFSAAILTTLVISLTNYGILARMRPMASVPIVPVAAVGWTLRRSLPGVTEESEMERRNSGEARQSSY